VGIDRRGFFRLVFGGFALLQRGAAAAPADAPAIHRDTRNTPIGALGPQRRPPENPDPFKEYPEAPRVALPPPVAEPARALAQVVREYAPTPGFAATPLPLDRVARLLHFGNGVTGRAGGTLLRAAPSAGALYAGEVYLVAERVQGLAPGVYYYRVADHGLARIRSGSSLGTVAAALEESGAVANAAAVVLLTNVFRRYSARYRNRAYRYALIDSGHIGENLRLAARSAGLGETAPLRFHDDALAELLGIDGRDEAVCAVHAVGEAGPQTPTPLAGARRFDEKQFLKPAVLQGRGLLTRRYHEATTLLPSAGGTGSSSSPPTTSAPPAGERLPIRRRERPPATAVEEAIHRRRSTARFESEDLSLKEVSFVLEMARGQPRLERAPGLSLYVVAHRVSGLQPGLYFYDPTAAELVAIRRGDMRQSLRKACLGQAKAASAGVGVLSVARFAESTSELGTRSYRDQLLESGAIAQRVYLGAEAAGLTARNLAAFLDDELNEMLGLDARREGVIHLTMFGRGN
jgi:SagB-type dehydrogenase family enzyme